MHRDFRTLETADIPIAEFDHPALWQLRRKQGGLNDDVRGQRIAEIDSAHGRVILPDSQCDTLVAVLNEVLLKGQADLSSGLIPRHLGAKAFGNKPQRNHRSPIGDFGHNPRTFRIDWPGDTVHAGRAPSYPELDSDVCEGYGDPPVRFIPGNPTPQFFDNSSHGDKSPAVSDDWSCVSARVDFLSHTIHRHRWAINPQENRHDMRSSRCLSSLTECSRRRLACTLCRAVCNDR